METKSDIELKKLASRRGPQQSLAFDELARRIREDPSTWNPEEPWWWNPLDVTRAPNVIEAEWAFLKCSQQYNEDRDPELAQKQDVRLEELDKQLARATDSLHIRYHAAVVQEISS